MNKTQITCEICRDLIPLVKDGVASADSEQVVREHTAECTDCAALFDGAEIPAPPPNSAKTLKRVITQLNIIYIALMTLGIYFGLTLTSGENLFYNCLIMPVAGVFGYLALKWRAFIAEPVVVLVLSFLASALGKFGTDKLSIPKILSWTFIYTLFAFTGSVITMLFKFAFSKNLQKRRAEMKGFFFITLKCLR